LSTQSQGDASETIEAVKSIMPFLGGDVTSENKASFLSYRATGFSFREACALTGVSQATIQRWRGVDHNWYDPVFAEMERDCSGPNRHQIRREVVSLLFTRNYHLILRKDHEVLMKTLGMVKETNEDGDVFTVPPSREESNYLAKARSHYTPQQMEAVERMLDPSEEKGFDFSEFIVKMTQRTRKTETETIIELEG